MCFCRSTYCIYIDISFLKIKNINTKLIYIFSLSSRGWLTCNEHVLYIFLQSWGSVVFITVTVRVSLNLSDFNNLFLEEWWQILIKIYSSLHLKIRVKSAGHRTVSGWSLTTPAGHRRPTSYASASADVFIYRRRPALVRYVTTQKKILNHRPVPGRLSNSPVMCKSLKSYDVSFICDRSINNKYESSGRLSFRQDFWKLHFKNLFCDPVTYLCN